MAYTPAARFVDFAKDTWWALRCGFLEGFGSSSSIAKRSPQTRTSTTEVIEFDDAGFGHDGFVTRRKAPDTRGRNQKHRLSEATAAAFVWCQSDETGWYRT